MFYISPSIKIALDECQFSFARSGGPGGQNVNKVNSKAILRWPVVYNHSLPPAVRARFLAKYASRITADGDLILSSQKYRDQSRNIDDCLEKLKTMIINVAVAPIERRATKPTLASKQRRRQAKREHSQKKQHRRPPAMDE
jgi:ribosome-associated protein